MLEHMLDLFNEPVQGKSKKYMHETLHRSEQSMCLFNDFYTDIHLLEAVIQKKCVKCSE